LDDIAAAAEVSVQSVYFHFGNKPALLKRVVDVASVGDDEEVAVLDRPWVQDIRSEPDPRRALALWIHGSRAIYERVAPILAVVRQAAGVDADLRAQWETNERQRLVAHRQVAELLVAKEGLRPEVPVDRATDIIFTLAGPEVFLLLTEDRQWSGDDWEHFVTSSLADALLAAPSPPPRSRR
jgi:AcrR family transcriptional regulator